VALFTAYQDDQLAGRISAQVDRQHLERYHDACGLFGFFDTVNDAKVGKALVDAAASWLKQRGMRSMRGPFLAVGQRRERHHGIGPREPSIYGTPYTALPGRHRARRPASRQCKDLLSWRYLVGNVPARAQARARRMCHARGARSVRCAGEARHVRARVVMDVFNDAWAENFHFVPMTDAELPSWRRPALVLDERIALVAEVDGKPAAIALALPNLNEAHGRPERALFPLGLPKLLLSR
jgi:hypothetical protein